MYGNRSISSLDVGDFYCQPSSVASYHCSTISGALPKIILHEKVDGSPCSGRLLKSWRDNIKEWTGKSLSLQKTEVDGQ